MPRIPRVRGLSSLQFATASKTAASRTPFATTRALSTSSPLASKNTEWIRGKLWQGKPPGAEDPYTQRPELEEKEVVLEPRDRTPIAVQESRLVLPPRRTEATPEKELEAIDPSYTPAETMEGLEQIKPVSSWWEQPGHWGEESKFRGFASAGRVTDKAELEVYLRRAVVEALALQNAQLLESWAVKKWDVGERAQLDQALNVEITVQDGKATLKGDLSGVTNSLTNGSEEAAALGRVSPEEAAEMVKAWSPEWKGVALDEQLKFAVRKRLYQLSGQLIPDAKLGAARSAAHLLTLMATPTKRNTKKLAEVLETKPELGALPNVTLHNRRVTPIDKEAAVGRWKVIEEELKKRDLPVTGTAGLGRNKEREWLSGRT